MRRSFYVVNNTNYHPRVLTLRQRDLGGYMTRFNQNLACNVLKYGSIPCLKKDETIHLFRISFDVNVDWNTAYRSVEFMNNVPWTPNIESIVDLINIPQITESGESLIKEYHENVCKLETQCSCHL
jgi:predicted transcriptional regulator